MIGAGARGIGVYGDYAAHHPDKLRFVAVAEPDSQRRMYFAMVHQLDPTQMYESDVDILKQPKLADCCFICTQDNKHIEPALTAMELGYHVFLEKPMAVTPKDCLRLEAKARATGVKVMIGHVLRYTPFFAKIKEWLDEGYIGDLMTIQHNENVSYWHQAHSYVRGNWRNVASSSPMILAKSCHDLDLLCWFAGANPEKVASFGKLSHFKTEHAPTKAPAFCLDGCPHQDDCLYYAPRVYLHAPIWMKLPVANDMSDASLLNALKQGPYGRCVYHSDNDVVDHQVTIIEFAGGITAAFTMTAFTRDNTRTIKLMGTKGEIRGHLEKNELELIRFGEAESTTVNLGTATSEHGGGDKGIMDDFVAYVGEDVFKEKFALRDSVTSHLLAFAAEKSRNLMTTIAYEEYLQSLAEADLHPCRPDEYWEAVRLANTVFSENMLEQYPLLLGQANRERMLVASIGGKVRAVVNYYPAKILIGGAELTCASIGAVATESAYRHQGLATKLLRFAESRMRTQKINLAIISGYDGIYAAFGATRVGNVFGYEFHSGDPDDSIELRTYTKVDFSELVRLSANERIRYRRTLEEFAQLLRGQLQPVKLMRHHLEIICRHGLPTAYVFFREYLEKSELLIREIAGNREDLLLALPQLAQKYGKEKVIVPVDQHDEFVRLAKAIPHQTTDQHASFKVLDWNGFLEELASYFSSVGVDPRWVRHEGTGEQQKLRIGEREVVLADIHELHRLVFGPNGEIGRAHV